MRMKNTAAALNHDPKFLKTRSMNYELFIPTSPKKSLS